MGKNMKRTMIILGCFCLVGSTQVFSVSAEETFSYADVSELEFYFSSGAGAWSTCLRIGADGSFEGNYHDSDMGTRGEGYPNGTIYVCDFSGQLSEPEKVNEYTYSAEIESIQLENEPGTVEIMDDIQYIYSEPYGLDDAQRILFYLQGAPLAELPEGFLGWVGYYDLSATEDTNLSFVGLYNETAQEGFSGYEREKSTEEEASGIDKELEQIEQKAAELEAQSNRGSVSQAELNEISGELYMLWDDEINSIWRRLKDLLPEEEMEKLTAEELEWIKEKEAAVAAAGAEVEGGSMQSMVENGKAAQITRLRVYELADYMK